MQKSNNTKYLLVAALFVFASTKKVYAESENVDENSLILPTEEQLLQESSNLIRQEELLKELLSLPNQEEQNQQQEDNPVEQTSSPSDIIVPEDLDIPASVDSLTQEEQGQLFTNLVNSLSPEEQEQFIELLEEAAQITENSQDKEEQAEQVKTLFEKFNASRCLGFCIKVALAMLCWEIVQPHNLVDENPWLPKSCPEIFKILIGVLLVDDIKDFIKEFKKSTETECRMLYKTFFPVQENR